MSWNKNTVTISDLNARLETLEEINIPFFVIQIGIAQGYGLNDPENFDYQLRMLAFRDKVHVEQMVRTYDCDSDDTLICIPFTKDQLPEKFPLEVYIDSKDYGDSKKHPKTKNIVNLREIYNAKIKLG